MNLISVGASKKAMKTIARPVWNGTELIDYNIEYITCVDITLPKSEWERIQQIVEIHDMTSKHPALQDLAMQYHMMQKLIKKEL
jgi:hypothetical protein